jgi:thiol-disulfide isomerase/thioredoxin
MRRALLGVFVLISLSGNAETISDKLIAVGIQAFEKRLDSLDFELEDLDGRMRKLSSFQGKVVFLNFWATWCGPCRVEMPSMQRMYDELKSEGLEIVAVDLQETERQVKSFVEEFDLSFPVLLDKSGIVGATYAIRSIPTTYLIDRGGSILARAIGAREWDAPEIMILLREILKE